ncbi:hypothetical protein [Bacillus massilinigeriensis]|uniref:hypothetical protein n=1 Tax=Bacillus mediterraneensis TaxID=1805474 RepID=UPI00114D4537|nr:hypothetical protein [Bacillus mediterraneensis]
MGRACRKFAVEAAIFRGITQLSRVINKARGRKQQAYLSYQLSSGAKNSQFGAKINQLGAKINQLGAKINQLGAKINQSRREINQTPF